MLLVIFDHIEFTLRSNLTTNRILHLQISIRPITLDNINCSMKKLSCLNLYRNIFIILGQLLERCRNQMCKSHFIPESFLWKFSKNFAWIKWFWSIWLKWDIQYLTWFDVQKLIEWKNLTFYCLRFFTGVCR